MEYFKFEEDFMEENVRCIPMVVRFKMDLAGIKLKLGEWGRFGTAERIELALLPVTSAQEIKPDFKSFSDDFLFTSINIGHSNNKKTD
ncbi:MAG: hypothetical protein EOP04_20525, partial [Proteobacteria bacterium]